MAKRRCPPATTSAASAHGGQTYHHLLDPRTGRPALGAAATTVRRKDPELANAAAVALLVGGPAAFQALAHAASGVDCALLVTDGGELVMTPAMAGPAATRFLKRAEIRDQRHSARSGYV